MHVEASLLQNLDADKVLEGFGKYGRYQLSIYIMAGISFFIFSYQTTLMALIGEPLQECSSATDNSTNNLTNTTYKGTLFAPAAFFQTNGTAALKKLVDDKSTYFTIANDFNINCENNDLLEHANGAFMLGNFLNIPLSTYLADRYGRRYTFLIPLWLNIICSVACSFAPNYAFFLAFRFLSGSCSAAITVVGFVLTVESVAASFRSIQALINSLIWVAGIFAVGILHIFIHNWRYLYLCVVIPGLISLAYYYFLPESIHWLIANKRTKQVRRYIIKSSRVNKVTLDLHACQSTNTTNDCLVVEQQREENPPQQQLTNGGGIGISEDQQKPRRNFLDLLRSGPLFFHLILNCYIFVVMNFVYWTLTLNSVELHENKLMGFFLSAAVEVPAGVLATLFLAYFGRRSLTIISLIGQSACLGLTIISQRGSSANLLLCLLAKILNSIAWASQPLLLSEMAPTTVRNMFFGIVSTAGEIGSVFAPYLERIGDESRQKVLITLMSTLAILFSMTPPETRGRALPQDIDDFDPGPFLRAVSKCWASLGIWRGKRRRRSSGSGNGGKNQVPSLTIVPSSALASSEIE